MKKIISSLLICFMSILFLPMRECVFAEAKGSMDNIEAKSALLIEPMSGKILYEKIAETNICIQNLD